MIVFGLGITSLTRQGGAKPRVTALAADEVLYQPLEPGVSRYWASHPLAGTIIPDTAKGQEDARGRYELIALRNPVTTGGASWWGTRASTIGTAALTDTQQFWGRLVDNRLAFSTRLAGGGQDFARVAHGVEAGGLSFATPIITVDVAAYEPNRATTPTVTSPSAGTLRVALGAAPGSNGAAITSIEIRRSTYSDMSDATTATVDPANRAVNQDYSVAGGVWYVDVRERNSVGWGPRSAVASALVDGSLAAPPQQAATAFFMRGGADPAVFFVGPFSGASITTGTIRVYAADDTVVGNHLAEIDADDGFEDENGAVEYPLLNWSTGDYRIRGLVTNATGSSDWSEPSVTVTVTSGLALATDNGSLVVSSVDEDFETLTVDVGDTEPASFEGSYTVTAASLADGLELLAAPVVSGTASLGATLTGTRALWVYDVAAYVGAPKPFQVSRQWRRDGDDIDGETDYTVTASSPGVYTLAETTTTPQGGVVEAVSNGITITSAVTLAAVPMDGRRIDLSGIIADGQKVAVVALFGAARTDAAEQVFLSSTSSGLYFNDPVTGWINTNGTLAVRGQATSESVATATTSAAVMTATALETMVIMVADQTQAGGAYRYTVQGVNSANNRVIARTATASILDMPLSTLTFGARPDGSNDLHPDTTLKFLWIATTLPPTVDDDLRTVRDLIRDALFVADGAVFTPRGFNATGSVTIGNTVVNPVVFLAGAQLGQYDDIGTTRLDNLGSGTDPELIGDDFP